MRCGAAGVTGLTLYSLLVAVIGAVVVLLAYHAITRITYDKGTQQRASEYPGGCRGERVAHGRVSSASRMGVAIRVGLNARVSTMGPS